MKLPDLRDARTLGRTIWAMIATVMTLALLSYFWMRKSLALDWDSGLMILLWLGSVFIGWFFLWMLTMAEKERFG